MVSHETQVRLQYLADIHARRHTQRIENDIHGSAIRQERHVLFRQDLGDDALVAVATGHLVAFHDLALLGDVDAHQLVYTRAQLIGGESDKVAIAAVAHGAVGPLAVVVHSLAPHALVFEPAEDLNIHHLALLAMRHPQRDVAGLLRLLAEDGDDEPLLRSQLALALRGNLAHQDIFRAHLRADSDDAGLVQVLQHILADVRDVARDLFRTELRVARLLLVLLNVYAGEHIVLHEALGDEDGILIVVAAPRHEGHQHVLPKSQLAVVRAGTIRQHLVATHTLSLTDQRTLRDARGLVGAQQIHQAISVALAILCLHHNLLRRYAHHRARPPGKHHRPGVARGALLHPRLHQRRIRTQGRHCLPLHVGAHQGAVGIVVLEEGNHGCGYRDNLHRRHVHVLHLARRHYLVAVLVAHLDGLLRLAFLVHKVPVLVKPLVARRDVVAVVLVRLHPLDLVGYAAMPHLAVRSLQEAEPIHPRMHGHAANEADVGPFRRLDRADASVVAVVHVAHFQLRALPGEAARPQRRKPPLRRELRERIRLIHELAELAGAEEALDGGGDRLYREDDLRDDGVAVQRRHPLLGHLLHAQKAHAKLAVQKLAHAPDALVLQVVNVVNRMPLRALGKVDDVAQDAHHVLTRDGPGIGRNLDIQLLVDLVPADLCEVVAPRIIEDAEHEVARRFRCRRIAGPYLAVDIQQGLFDVGGRIHKQRCLDVPVRPVDPNLRKAELHDGCRQRLVNAVQPTHERLLPLRIQDLLGCVLADEIVGRKFREHLGSTEEPHDIGRVGTGRLKPNHVPLADLLGELIEGNPLLVRGELLLKVAGLPRGRDTRASLRQDFTSGCIHHGFHKRHRKQVVLRSVPRLAALRLHGPIDPELLQTLLDGHLHRHARVIEGVERAEQGRQRELARLAYAHLNLVIRRRVNIHPRTLGGDEGCAVEHFAGEVYFVLKVDTRGSRELADHYPLGSVNDESALVRHQREVAKVHFALNHLLVGLGQLHPGLDGRLERHVAIAALLDGVLRLTEGKIDQGDGGIAGEIVDRREALEELGQAFFEKPLVGFELQLDQVGNINYVGSPLRIVLDFLQSGASSITHELQVYLR